MQGLQNHFPLFAAVHTPFTPSGRLAAEVVWQQAARLAAHQMDGAFVAGTTGECSSLLGEERQRLAELWVAAAARYDLHVIVHVGHNCQHEAIRLAEHAQQVGADAVAAHAPCFLRPTTVEQLVEFLAPIGAAAADLPFYYYDIPALTGVHLPAPQVLQAAKPRIPNLVGIKYSNPDLSRVLECLQLEDDFEVLFGCDEMLLSAVALGAHGAVGSTYNFAAPLYRQMLAAHGEGDHGRAAQLQGRALQLVRLLQQFDYLPASKAIMAVHGIDCGPVRPPLRNLPDAERERLRVAWEAGSREAGSQGIDVDRTTVVHSAAKP